jgi:hypothetical protein
LRAFIRGLFRVSKACRYPRQIALALASFVILAITACQPQAEALSTTDHLLVIPSPTETNIPPPAVVKVESSQNRPSFRPMDTGQIAATATSNAASIIDLNLDEAPVVASPTVAQHGPTATIGPTFTPPEAPQSSQWDHFWLRRPVPVGSAVWTDKAYPYGSNRGGTLRTHHGVEFNVPYGTEVLAAGSGTVVVAGDDRSSLYGPVNDFYGNIVVIKHDIGLDDQPIYSLYGHLSQILVNQDQKVFAQDVIALSGASGVADGPHLHFEVRVGENSYDSTYNPLLWLYPFPDRGVVAGKITNGSQAMFGVPLKLRRIDAPSAYAATATYADDSVNPDPNWQENFVFDDVVAGYYELEVGSGDEKLTAEFWVYPAQTSFVEITF